MKVVETSLLSGMVVEQKYFETDVNGKKVTGQL
jgi:hypothetical protein